jgi:hypothetical protein
MSEYLSIAASIGGGLMSAAGNSKSGAAARQVAEYNAKIQERNAEVFERNAEMRLTAQDRSNIFCSTSQSYDRGHGRCVSQK